MFGILPPYFSVYINMALLSSDRKDGKEKDACLSPLFIISLDFY